MVAFAAVAVFLTLSTGSPSVVFAVQLIITLLFCVRARSNFDSRYTSLSTPSIDWFVDNTAGLAYGDSMLGIHASILSID